MPDAIRFCAETFNPLGNRHEQAKDHERSDAREEIDCRIPTVPGDLDGAEYQPAQAAPAPGSTKQEANFQLTCRGSSSGTRARGRRCSASTGLVWPNVRGTRPGGPERARPDVQAFSSDRCAERRADG